MLAGAGAQQLLVLNLPDLGATPALSGNAGATAWTMGFNALLANELSAQRNTFGITIYEAEMFALSGDIQNNPGIYGLTNSTDPVVPDFTLDPALTAYWDDVHPTTAVHRIYADSLSVPEPSVGMFALAAMGLLALRRRRG